MDKPLNPYRKGSLAWSLMEGDWEDLTKEQIAEVLGYDLDAISDRMKDIKSKTGYAVPHVKKMRRKGR